MRYHAECKLLAALLALAALVTSGCATVSVTDYAREKPALDLTQYFNGTLDGWGILSKLGVRVGELTLSFRKR